MSCVYCMNQVIELCEEGGLGFQFLVGLCFCRLVVEELFDPPVGSVS